jgi:ribosomal peptide maturation radical SAM protein 1
LSSLNTLGAPAPFKHHLTPAPVATRVALVNMPFAFSDRPSIQCGLLKSILTRVGHEVDVFYLNLELAAETSSDFYHEVAHIRSDLMLGDWLFSVAAFGPRDNEELYKQTCPVVNYLIEKLNLPFERICEMRNKLYPDWINRWADQVEWDQYSIVGFTTTFEQNCASFALARAIKERHPGVQIVFGGSNFDAGMGKEFLRALPFIDYAVIGEGDFAFPEMVARIACGEDPIGIPGVAAKREGVVVGQPPGSLIEKLDLLPDPQYDEYFGTLFRLGQSRVLGTKAPLLLIESARGCWWGEKKHCTFCGLNNNGLKFRSKSASEVLGQLRRLSDRYKIVNFEAVDNIIDHRYITELCGPLSESHFDYRLFYELKSNISPAQLRTLARAGVLSIQPGIESLNTHILNLMRKGVTMLRNVRCLKWAYYYGMRVSWNILTGFPGETEEDYQQQAAVLRKIRHLPPPEGGGRIWLERFSPYFFDPSFPVSNVRPLEVYGLIYPEELIDLGEVAYFFKYDMDNVVPESALQEMNEVLDTWRAAWERRPKPALVYQRAPDWIQFVDRRGDKPVAHAFSGLEVEVYESCGETDQTVASVHKAVTSVPGLVHSSEEEVSYILRKFCDLDLMLEEDGRYLSLALPANPHW